jgi:hypothetical protein
MALLIFLRGVVCLELATIMAAIAYSQPPVLDEYQVKAAFLYNFAKFVEWPSAAFKNPDDPIAICVLGQNPFGSALEDIINGKRVADRGLRVRQVSDQREAARCHIVFVSAADDKRTFLEEVKSLPVLTIGERDGFLADGGIIVFTVKDTRVHFDIDADGAARAKLKISSKLLSLAESTKK